jgi:hypothetical protein
VLPGKSEAAMPILATDQPCSVDVEAVLVRAYRSRPIAIDATCWHGLDPRTLLLTTASPEELLQRGFLSTETEPLAAQAVLASEYERDDYNTFAALAGRRAPVGILSEATRGRPERSARYFPRPSRHPLRNARRVRHPRSRLGLRRIPQIPSDRGFPASGRPAHRAAFAADRGRPANVFARRCGAALG